ncbi:hypothetical protein G5V58_01175 [Nocardioides anomalus]|uniref:PKD domain-containing protein n=1 Tax=Nocardioides anomalus TaxID=2712223 RepID=A0A6G6W8M2_9ACTN|nr:hypothetical protein [Nocardioides anomalus]QIG41566.1 hypothetical protein G5V58_01175 [Nocardioides anomalus]
MNRLVACACLFASLVVIGPAANAAGCSTSADGEQVNGGIAISHVNCPPPDVVTDVGHLDNGPRDSNLDGICVSTAISVGIDPFKFCDEPSEPGQAEVTGDLVAAALKFVPLPPSVLTVEPPNGRTLVNFDTNFFTTTQPFDTAVTLLGQRVDLHITPAHFTWQFGDGESSATTEPGAPFPALDVTHAYRKKGHVAPSVDTTYTAQFRVNGGPWRDVPGTVTIAGAAVDLQVLTATPVLVGYN